MSISKALEQMAEIQKKLDSIEYVEEKPKSKVRVSAERVVRALEKRPRLLTEVRELLWHEGRVLTWSEEVLILPASYLTVSPEVEGIYRLLINFDCDTPCKVVVSQGHHIHVEEEHDGGLFVKQSLVEILANPLRIRWVKTEDSPDSGLIEAPRLSLVAATRVR